MKLKQVWKYHLVLGIVIIILHLSNHYVYGTKEVFFEGLKFPAFLLNISFFITFFSIYFLNFNWACPKILSKKHLVYYIIVLIGLVFLFAGIRFFLEEIIGYKLTGYHNYHESKRTLGYYVYDNYYYALKAILFSTSLYLLLKYLENKDRILNLEIEHKKAELNILKNQLEPHFLFNTLNTFYTELVDTQPKVAKNIHKLSEMLRYVTYKTQNDFVPLKQELTFIEDYIHLNRERFEDHFFMDYTIEGITKQQQIPSLVLIHFVENIFKHGVLNDRKHPAALHICISENYLELKTKNRISKVPSYSSSGIGRENLKKRLSLIYKDAYEFQYGFKESYFETHLKIPFIK